jgi:predicted amidohydrolase
MTDASQYLTSDATGGLSVAIVQMNSGADKAQNIATALDLIDRAAATGARLVALPESLALSRSRRGQS